MSPARPHLRHGAVADPVLVGLVSAVVYVLHGYEGLLTRDLGVFTYGGQHVADGVPPYAGIFNSVGPLADAVPGLAIWVGRLVGVGPVTAERVLFTVLSAACCALLCVLARDVLGSRAAGFVAASVFLTFQDFLDLASDGPREKTTMVLFLLAALVLVGRRRWLAAGICTALATLAWQPVLAVAVTATLVTLLATGSGRLRAAAAYVAGGVLTTAAFAAYFALHGDLRLAVDGFMIVNLDYTQQPSLVSDPHHIWGLLWQGYHVSIWLIPLGLGCLLAVTGGAVARWRRDRRVPFPVGPVALAAAATVGTLWTVLAVNGPPDLFELLPFAAIGIAGTVVVLGTHLQVRHAYALAGTVTAVAVTIAGVESVTTRNDQLDQERGDIAAVLAAAPADATLLSIDAPEVMALAGRTNPDRFQVFDRPMERFINHRQPGGLAGYATWVARDRPTFVVVGHQLPWWSGRELAHDYTCVGRGPLWTWYLSRSAGPAAALAVEAANRAAMDEPPPVDTEVRTIGLRHSPGPDRVVS